MLCFAPVYSHMQCRLCKGRSMYRYEGHGLGCSTRAPKVHKLGGGTRAHKVHKGCWVGGMPGNGVLWRHPVPSRGVPWSKLPRSLCHGQHTVAVSLLCLV